MGGPNPLPTPMNKHSAMLVFQFGQHKKWPYHLPKRAWKDFRKMHGWEVPYIAAAGFSGARRLRAAYVFLDDIRAEHGLAVCEHMAKTMTIGEAYKLGLKRPRRSLPPVNGNVPPADIADNI